jgi:mannose-1-phosphate guanylyltransferase
MHAIVLVGGFGTRLRPLTNDVPKPMLPIGHRPMIVRLVDRLATAGVTDVTLALGFRPEPFLAAFPGDRHGDVRVHYAVEPEPLDTAGAIRFAADFVGVDGTFVVLNGDVISEVDIAALVAAHRRHGGTGTIHLTPVEDPSAFGVVETDPAGRVVRFVEKPAPGTAPSNLINAGTYVLEPAALERIPSGERVSIERSTFPAMVDAGELFAVATDDYWLDTGRPDTYLAANLDLLDGRWGGGVEAVAEGARIDPDGLVQHSIIGHDATVGAGALIVDSVLLPGATVESGARIERSIVAGTVGADAVVRDCVVGHTGVVSEGADLHSAKVPEPT